MKELIKNISDIEYFQAIDLTNYTTTKTKSTGDLFIVRSLESLKVLVNILSSKKISYDLIGWGANTLLPLKLSKKLIKLDFKFPLDILSTSRDVYDLPASIGLNKLTAHAIKFGIKGWEVFTGIPASLGGAIFMNAGTSLGEIGDLVLSVDILKKSGEVIKIENEGNLFSYRKNNFCEDGDIIISARIKSLGVDESIKEKIINYISYRKDTQPLSGKNCGCVFKNSKKLGAGLLIDKIGLKGYEYSNFKISTIHGNFIENTGEGTLENFMKTTENIKFLVNLYSGVTLEKEVQLGRALK